MISSVMAGVRNIKESNYVVSNVNIADIAFVLSVSEA